MYLMIIDEIGTVYIHSKKDMAEAKAHAQKLHSSVEWKIVERVQIEVV